MKKKLQKKVRRRVVPDIQKKIVRAEAKQQRKMPTAFGIGTASIA